MTQRFLKMMLLFLLVSTLTTAGLGTPNAGNTQVSLTVSEVCIEADSNVERLGYVVNGDANVEKIIVSSADFIIIDVPSLPDGMELKTVVDYYGVEELVGHPVTLAGFPEDEAARITVHLSLIGTPVDDDNMGEDESGLVPSKPSTPLPPYHPVEPEHPDTPSDPETPDTPGSDEPLVPILPPADSVYNFAGFIPLVAGFLLLFLVFFWRRKVYRILKSHAKKHGEKPEKEHLKEIADAIIKLVRDDGRYPEWKKNSDVAKRLSADIVSVLDEMNYARAVPRGALVAEILKAARGRINRHRL